MISLVHAFPLAPSGSGRGMRASSGLIPGGFWLLTRRGYGDLSFHTGMNLGIFGLYLKNNEVSSGTIRLGSEKRHDAAHHHKGGHTLVAHDKADDKADEKGRESDSKETSDLAAQEAQRALGEQSKAGLRGSGEVDLKKNGAASSRGDTGEFGKFHILTDKDAGKAGGDVTLKTEKVSADSSLSDATKKTIKTLHEEFDLVLADGATVLKALEGKTKEQLREISKAYKEETGRDLATDIAKAQKFEKEHDEVPSSEKLGKALEVL